MSAILFNFQTMTEPRSLPNTYSAPSQDSLPPPLPERDYPPPLPLRCVPPPIPVRDYEAKPPTIPERESLLPPPAIPPRRSTIVKNLPIHANISTGHAYENGTNDGTWEWRIRGPLPERNTANIQLLPRPPPCPDSWARIPADVPPEVAPSPPHYYLTMKK